MKRFVSYVAAGMLAGAVAAPGLTMAQTDGANGAARGPVIITSEGAPASALPMNQYKAFDDFRQAHPDIAHDLARNPHLINSGRFQRQHPALRDFLSHNSGFAEDFSENPADYVLPARPRARRARFDRHPPSHTENGAAGANAEAGADAGANANAPSDSGGTEPSGVPAATGGAGEGNSGAGAAPGGSSGGNM
jgi:anti-sigma factor RsiW